MAARAARERAVPAARVRCSSATAVPGATVRQGARASVVPAAVRCSSATGATAATVPEARPVAPAVAAVSSSARTGRTDFPSAHGRRRQQFKGNLHMAAQIRRRSAHNVAYPVIPGRNMADPLSLRGPRSVGWRRARGGSRATLGRDGQAR